MLVDFTVEQCERYRAMKDILEWGPAPNPTFQKDLKYQDAQSFIVFNRYEIF